MAEILHVTAQIADKDDVRIRQYGSHQWLHYISIDPARLTLEMSLSKMESLAAAMLAYVQQQARVDHEEGRTYLDSQQVQDAEADIAEWCEDRR